MKEFALFSLFIVCALPAGNIAMGADVSPSPSPTPSTWCRFVPERKDDFAWENDLVAFRAYGPAIVADHSGEGSGIDCWLKRVPYPIVDKWYAGEQHGISYHQDHGEGYDPYHTGGSRGCGGLGIWRDGKLVVSGPYKTWKIISQTPQSSVFELTYEYDLDGKKVDETKRIHIELGQRLFEVESTFTSEGQPAPQDIAIGITTHNGKAKPQFQQADGIMSCWETIDGSGLGTAVVIDPTLVKEMRAAKGAKPDDANALLLTHTDAQGKIRYRAGSGWAKAGEITTPEKWSEYLKSVAHSESKAH